MREKCIPIFLRQGVYLVDQSVIYPNEDENFKNSLDMYIIKTVI